MKLGKIVLAPKMTGLEYDMHRYNRTFPEMEALYRNRNVDASRIVESHRRQKENQERVRQVFPEAEVLGRNQLSRERTRDADLVVALGGDNHLTYVAHYTDAPIVGINSDPETSEGVLLSFVPDQLAEIVDRVRADDVEIEEWPRIAAVLDGRPVEDGITEYFLGEREVFFTSYNVLTIGDRETIHRGSGTLVTNGVGSTGWYLSASAYAGGEAFDRTDRRLRVLAREPFQGSRYNTIEQADVGPGETITVSSNNDTAGIAVADSLREFVYDFAPGSVLELSLADRPTRIVRFPGAGAGAGTDEAPKGPGTS